MAKWSREKVSPENLNGGNQYEAKDRLSREQLNAMVNSGLYSQDFAEHLADAPDISQADTVGSAKVEVVDNVVGGKTYKKFKFSNLKGEKGDKGDKGEKGDKGNTGATPVITATATTLSAGSSATVTKSGTAENPTFAFGIPKGDKGDTGASAGFGTPTATIDSNVGTPSVTITASGSDTSKVFNFAFKNLKGEKGDKGNTGATGPKGDTGPQGPRGESGLIYQSTGTNTDGAMSQKATTDELNKKAKLDASNLSTTNVTSWKTKLGISNLETAMTVTRGLATTNSTYVSSGDIVYYVINKTLCIVAFNDVTFKNTSQPNDAVIASGLPVFKSGDGATMINLTCWGGTHQTVRYIIDSGYAGKIRNWWSTFTPTTSQKWSGTAVYRCEEI